MHTSKDLVYEADESDLLAAMLSGMTTDDIFVYLPVLCNLEYVEFVRFESEFIVFKVLKPITVTTGGDDCSDVSPGTLVKVSGKDKGYFNLIVKWLSEN